MNSVNNITKTTSQKTGMVETKMTSLQKIRVRTAVLEALLAYSKGVSYTDVTQAATDEIERIMG